MFEHLPYITEGILYYCHNEDLEALLADVKTPLEPLRQDNPYLYFAIHVAVKSVVQDIHDSELQERIVGNLWAEMFIVMRLLDLALGYERRSERLHSAANKNDN